MRAAAVATANAATAAHDILGSVLDHAVATPTRPAAKDDQRDLTFGQLRDAAGALAAGLAPRGGGRGDRIALQLPNAVASGVGALACLWRGAIFVPPAAPAPPVRVAGIVDDCDPALVLASPAIEHSHSRAVDVAEVTGSP